MQLLCSQGRRTSSSRTAAARGPPRGRPEGIIVKIVMIVMIVVIVTIVIVVIAIVYR